MLREYGIGIARRHGFNVQVVRDTASKHASRIQKSILSVRFFQCTRSKDRITLSFKNVTIIVYLVEPYDC